MTNTNKTVRTPDGTIGTRGGNKNNMASVWQLDLAHAQGPWFYAPADLVPATAEQEAEYLARCDARQAVAS